MDVHGNLLSERTQSNLLANTSEEESEITLMTLPQILRGEALDLAQIMSFILRMGSVGPSLPHLNRGWAHPCHICATTAVGCLAGGARMPCRDRVCGQAAPECRGEARADDLADPADGGGRGQQSHVRYPALHGHTAVIASFVRSV